MALASRDAHAFGRQVLAAVWPQVTGREATLAELQIAGAQGHLESGYGRAQYKRLDHDTGAVLASSGVINNWGAVQTNDAAHGFLATDTHQDGTRYDHLYRVYDTPEEGARHMVEHMTLKRPTSWALMQRGDIDAWAEQMHQRDPQTGIGLYFEQAPSARAKGIELRVNEIAAALGEPVMAKRGGPAVPDGGDAGVPGAAPSEAGTDGTPSPLVAGLVGLAIGLGVLVGRLLLGGRLR